MATSRGLGEFGKRMKIVAEGVIAEADKTLRKAALAADQVAVLSTPVDTGRARANWIATIGAPAEGEFPPDPSGAKALEQALATVAQYRQGDGSIFLTNNVEYIVPLDEGHSKQAPAGMTAQALAAAVDVVRAAKLVK